MTISNPADLIPIIGIITALLAGIGYTFDGDEFIAPVVAEPAE